MVVGVGDRAAIRVSGAREIDSADDRSRQLIFGGGPVRLPRRWRLIDVRRVRQRMLDRRFKGRSGRGGTVASAPDTSAAS